MIVLDRIDPAARRIGWATTFSRLPGAEQRIPVEERLRELGVLRFQSLGPDSVSAFDHSWEAADGSVRYSSRCPLPALSPLDHAFYTAAALATATWAPLEDLLSVQLAVYELLANVHEHGRGLAADAPGVHLELRLSTDGVRGRLVDGCKRYSAPRQHPTAISDRVNLRERRGYGTAMIERALDEIAHGFGPTGNVIHFTKGFRS